MIHAQNHTVGLLLASAAQTNGATRTANLDTRDADYAVITLNFSAELNTNAIGPTIQLSESDDTVVTNFATFDSGLNVTGSDGWLASAKVHEARVDTKYRKRYIRLSVTAPTATNDTFTMGATYRLSKNEKPSATSEMAATTNDSVVIG